VTIIGRAYGALQDGQVWARNMEGTAARLHTCGLATEETRFGCFKVDDDQAEIESD
jgi:hypothetical protein